MGKYNEAANFSRRALDAEKDDTIRFFVNTEIALDYVLSDESDAVKADKIIVHTENALNIPGIEPNPFCYVLQGYGWALRGNADMPNAPKCEKK